MQVNFKRDHVPEDFGFGELNLYPIEPAEQIEMKTQELKE